MNRILLARLVLGSVLIYVFCPSAGAQNIAGHETGIVKAENKTAPKSNVFQDAALPELPLHDVKLDNHAYHVFSHGRPGQLLIWDKWMNAREIAAFFSAEMRSETFESLYIYGCEFGKGEAGREAVSYLEKSLGMAVAASDDVTGKDGDWDLEVGHPVTIGGMNSYAVNLQCAACTGTVGGTAPTDDLDGDGVCNSVDVDDDNDGLLDTTEGTSILNTVTNSTFTGNTTGWTLDPEWIYYFSQLCGRNDNVPNAKSASQSNVVLKNAYTSYAIYQMKVRTNDYIASNGALSTLYMNLGVYIGGTRLFGIANPASTANVTLTRDAAANNIVSNFWVNGALVGAGGSKAMNRDQTYDIQIAFNLAAMPSTGKIEFKYNANGDDIIIDDVYYYIEGNVDTDGDGVPNHMDLDSDNDGIPDVIEACGDRSIALANCRIPYSAASDPDGADADACPDGKVAQSCTTPKDTDNDGTPDYLDLDSDNDGCPDAREAGTGSFNVNTGNAYTAPAATGDGLTNAGCVVPANSNWTESSVKTACSPPSANDDSSNGSPVGSNVILNILTNDQLSNGTQATTANTTVTLTTNGLPAGSSVSGNTVIVPGQGTWTYNPATGDLIFDPESGFTDNPTPLTYTLTEISTNLTDTALVTITYSCLLEIGGAIYFDKNGIQNGIDGSPVDGPKFNFHIVLVQNDMAIANTAVQTDGSYKFVDVAPGRYKLVLRKDATWVTTPVIPSNITYVGEGGPIVAGYASGDGKPDGITEIVVDCQQISYMPGARVQAEGSYLVVDFGLEDRPLPVTLVDFRADASPEGVRLSWTTTEERNFDRFEIEKSENSKLQFNMIGTVPGGQSKYSFAESATASGPVYYRLKMIDLDGTYSYSRIVAFQGELARAVYPNPTRDRTIFIDKGVIDSFRVLNMAGRDFPATMERNGSISRITLGNGAMPGIYFLEYRVGILQTRVKFVVAE
jgi:hypothetical protein